MLSAYHNKVKGVFMARHQRYVKKKAVVLSGLSFFFFSGMVGLAAVVLSLEGPEPSFRGS